MYTENPQKLLSRTYTTGTFSEAEFRDSVVVPPSLAFIVAPILRVANEIEQHNKRVAYLCRFYAFEKAHLMDPSSGGRGVRQFKTALLQHLEEPSMQERTNTSDERELANFYQVYYKRYVKDREKAHVDRTTLAKAYQTAGVLLEVLKSVMNKTEEPVAPEILATQSDVDNKKAIFAPYNILPLDLAGETQAIMQLDEVKSSLQALRNTRGLPHLPFREYKDDTFDWLEATFGFQKASVMNQREHLILLLANFQKKFNEDLEPLSKLDRAIDAVMKKLFKNYRSWCKFLGRRNNLRLPEIYQDQQQRKIIYIGLYLLIWGEAANLRFMPECLCYIFHHMAGEVLGMLSGRVSYTTGKFSKPAYGGAPESFLHSIVTPIYNIIKKEAFCSREGRAAHSVWRNYDDLNEYFWSVDCFDLGWPMQRDNRFFSSPQSNVQTSKVSMGQNNLNLRRSNKTGFVEIRSFWHIFRSFHRMWTFFILSFQAMMVIAWSGSKLSAFSQFHELLSIFITAAAIKFLQGVLDVIFNLKAYHNLDYSAKLRMLLKLLLAAAWVLVLSVSYVQSSNGLTIVAKRMSWYKLAILIYLLPNCLGAIFFMLPMLRRWIENSNLLIIRLILWWSQPCLYIGRGMHESWLDLAKYTLFWISLLCCKLLFSYYIQIKPLVKPTKKIMDLTNVSYSWPELFPKASKNIGAVITLWAPVVLVYFMDTQIWYSIFSTLTGGFVGAFKHLGEIRTLEMLRSRFGVLPKNVYKKMVPKEKISLEYLTFAQKIGQYELGIQKIEVTVFGQVWNEVITSFREEDLISNKEMDLMIVPYISNSYISTLQWPPFLIVGKAPLAIQMVATHHDKHNNTTDEELMTRIKADIYMQSAIQECYDSLKYILRTIIIGKTEKRIVNAIIMQVEEHIDKGTFLTNFQMSALPSFCEFFTDLIDLLVSFKTKWPVSKREMLILLLQDMFEVVTTEMMADEVREQLESSHGPLSTSHNEDSRNIEYFATIEPEPAVLFPPPSDDAWFEQLRRLQIVLNKKESVLNIPKNLEARSRIFFFTSSLFMDMPTAPRVQDMSSFSVLTPYYDEDIVYTSDQLQTENEDGISILYYLQKIYPDEWKNFLERVSLNEKDDLFKSKERELRLWASYHGQTLSRTVRGMMYYKKALQLQAFQEMAPQEDIRKGYKAAMKDAIETPQEESYWETLHATIDLKFTYVATCQNYGAQKQIGDFRAKEILNLMKNYPSLRVAYVDKVEDKMKGKVQNIYYSVLVKGVDNDDQEVYRIKLPGPPIIGEGKPENQNHAIIFTRGEALQTIDMNQDNYLEEAVKMRNLLEEFKTKHGVRAPTILGVRELIFTGSVSSLAWFMSMQESSFVTIGQRVLANPLKVRFHYGHSDVFDRLFHITRGGVSKASKSINLSEAIFAGFNSTLRRGNITHHEYIQLGKVRDVGLNQISLSEAKLANGNGELTRSRDIYRLGHRFDFFRMMSCYFTTVGFYFNSMLVVLIVYIFLYGRLYLVLSGIEKSLIKSRRKVNQSTLQTALASQSIVHLGLVMILPMVMEIGLERGFYYAFSDFVFMQLQLAPVFFTFSLGTKAHYYGRTILHGGAKYRETGRGFIVRHERFAENYRLYSRSHFTKGFEIMILLIIYDVYGASPRGHLPYLLVTLSLWFLAGTWLFAPFLFNPSAFEWQNSVEDWDDWNKWINNKTRIGVPANRSWESWWVKEQKHLKCTGLCGRVMEIMLAIRFFLYQYGLVYRLHISRHRNDLSIYGYSWLVLVLMLALVKIISMTKQWFKKKFPVAFRILMALLCIFFSAIIIILFHFTHSPIGDVLTYFLAFMPTGWAILQIAQACEPLVVIIGGWDSIVALARSYENIMGLVLFFPIVVLAWFPFVSDFQTRLLFNQAFSRGLEISRILGGNKKKISQD